MRTNVFLLFVVLLAIILEVDPAFAQITGSTSLLTVPVADMPADGTVTFGISYVDKKYSKYLNGRVDYRPLYAAIVFLPFLELGFRFSRPMGLDDRSRLGDRMAMARIRILTEKGRRPALLIGAHDFFTTVDRNYFNALYVVASKHIETVLPVAVHLGYGTDKMDALAHQFVGVFAGLAVSLFRYTEVIVEYDAERVNVGARLTLFSHFQGLVALQGLDTIIAGASVNIRL